MKQEETPTIIEGVERTPQTARWGRARDIEASVPNQVWGRAAEPTTTESEATDAVCIKH